MARLNLLNFWLFGILLKCVWCANILYIDPVISPSHHLWNMHIAKAMVQRGHNVTILTHSAEEEYIKNLHFIHIEGVYEQLDELNDYVEWAEQQLVPSYSDISLVYDWQEAVATMDLETKGLSRIRNYPNSFKVDLIIMDITGLPYMYALIDKFNRPPVVAVTPFLLPSPLNIAMGNHLFTPYTPNAIAAYTNEMTLTERFHNTIYHMWDWYQRRFVSLPSQEQFARDYFGTKDVRPLVEYEKNFSMLLCNYDPMFEYPISLAPNVIPVGTLHARLSNKLDPDLKQVLDNATNGVIYVSFGTNIRSSDLRPEMRENIIAVLGKLKQTVLWKVHEEIKDLPNNVITRKFFQQTDILNHPNVRLFVMHGGALSMHEAMFFGMPMVVTPFFLDQKFNAKRIAVKNVGEYIPFDQVNKDSLYNAIQKVLNNPKYKAASKRISEIVKARPQTGLDTALYWIEQTLKYGFIEELRLPTNRLTFIEVHNLDIFLTPIIVLIVVIIATRCFKSKTDTVSRKLKSN